jgi:signal transduction histidine kinase
LLNLINNAFQACADRTSADRTSADRSVSSVSSVSAVSEITSPKAMSSPDPKVEVSTKNLGDQIQITVSDNGPGIPDEIKGKIFQPFFTTKPTGQGTGLGLSLSYDIVKAHGGELKVDSKEGMGSIFKIILPN